MQPRNQKSNDSIESVLIADCGSNTTRVVLVEVVDNAYRFVARGAAPSTIEEPYYNVTVGVINAVSAIQASTGRKLLTGSQLIMPQWEDGSGVDAFIASSSAAEAMRVVAAGLIKDLSTQIAAEASHGTYTQVLDTISLDDFGDNDHSFDPDDPDTEFSPFNSNKAKKAKKGGMSLFGNRAKQAWRDRQVAKLRRLGPNVVVLSGGVDGAPIEPLLELLGVIIIANQQEAVLAEATGETRRPLTMVYAGNQDAQDALISKLGGRVEFFMSDNIRPVAGKEQLAPLQKQLSDLYQERILPSLPGYDRLAQMSLAPINTTCFAVGLMTRFLARYAEGNQVLTADLGGGSASLFYANSSEFTAMVAGNFGMSFGMSNVLAEVGVAEVKRWLPFAATDNDVIHYAMNKTIRPQILPFNERELQLEGAFGRAILRYLYKALQKENSHANNFNRLIGIGGALVSVQPWLAALTLLDSFEPLASSASGILDLELDSTMLMAAAGALATYNPNAAAYVFQYDTLHRLGSVLVPSGEGTLGSTAVTVKLQTKGGRTKEVSVPFGELAIIPLRSDEQATLEIRPHKNFRIGSAKPGVAVTTSTGEELRGGSVGLIIDARGRPIRYANNPPARQEQLARWYNVYRETLRQAESEEPVSVGFAPRATEPARTAKPLTSLNQEAKTAPPQPALPKIASAPSKTEATVLPMPKAEIPAHPPAPISMSIGNAVTMPPLPSKEEIPAPIGQPNTAPAGGLLAQLREEETKTAKFGQAENATGGGALSRRAKGRSATTSTDNGLDNLRDLADDKDKKKKKK